MVITVEPGTRSISVITPLLLTLISPGIYVPPTPQFPKVFHNMGIRIEVRDRIRLL